MPVKIKKLVNGGYEYTVGLLRPKPGSARGLKRRAMAERLWKLEAERVAVERAERQQALAALYGHGG